MRLEHYPKEKMWIELAKTRNLTVHTYKEKLAEQLYAELPNALEKLQELERKIKERIGKESVS